MQLKTILNRVEPFKSFVYTQITMIDDGDRPQIEVAIEPRSNGRPLCSGCGQAAPGYDRQRQPRRFEYVPLWGMSVCFLYMMRRVNCATCGVKVEQVPWGDGKCHLTTSYRWFLARWAKRLSWKEVAGVFHTSWENVFRAVKYAVFWGLVHRDESGIEAIGVDEIQWSRGHKYLTLVYQIDDGLKRLLWIGGERTEESLRGFFQLLTDNVRTSIRFVCSDMWKPYLKVVREELGQAVHVLDRFHLMKKMNEAIDQVRRDEVPRLKQAGYEEVLKHSRWCLLKAPREPDRPTDGEACGTDEAQSPLGAGPSAAGRLPAILGIQQSGLGGQVPRRVVPTNDAIAAGTDAEGRGEPAPSSIADPQLVPRPRHDFRRHRRGPQQQGQTDHQKSIRLSDLRSRETRFISHTRALPQPKFTHEFC